MKPPKHVNNRAQFKDAAFYAAEVFTIAEHVDYGLDEGQRRMVAEIAARLDQLTSELLDEERSGL